MSKKRVLLAVIVSIIVIALAAILIIVFLVNPGRKSDNQEKENNGGISETPTNGKQSKKKQYEAAQILFEDGEYEKAIAVLEALDGYKDSEDLIIQIKIAQKTVAIKHAAIGDCILFGGYDQNNDSSNGGENIEWLVLAREEDKLLVISKDALECREYHTIDTPWMSNGIDWENCDLREWLNEYFFSVAFSRIEQKMVLVTAVTADANPLYDVPAGNDTNDKIFLLSIDEVNRYFRFENERICAPTGRAIAQKAKNNDGQGTDKTFWWLRSPGRNVITAAYVDVGGSVVNEGIDVDSRIVCVRPAMWIDIGAYTPEAVPTYSPTLMPTPISTPTPTPTPAPTPTPTPGATATMSVKTGEYITFGSYRQNIEWLVLDVQGDKALVISRYAIDTKMFGDVELGKVTWENSSIRQWLNAGFKYSAFSTEEMSRILETTVKAEKNADSDADPGNDTVDKIFLLSISEVNKYFGSNEARKCIPTEYAINKGTYTDLKGYCEWWLRTPGSAQIFIATVDHEGKVISGGYFAGSEDGVGVRPAMWIDLKKSP